MFFSPHSVHNSLFWTKKFLKFYNFQLQVLCWSRFSEVSGEVCAPTCKDLFEGQKTRDPIDCTKYYYCSDPHGGDNLVPSETSLSCPDG